MRCQNQIKLLAKIQGLVIVGFMNLKRIIWSTYRLKPSSEDWAVVFIRLNCDVVDFEILSACFSQSLDELLVLIAFSAADAQNIKAIVTRHLCLDLLFGKVCEPCSSIFIESRWCLSDLVSLRKPFYLRTHPWNCLFLKTISWFECKIFSFVYHIII